MGNSDSECQVLQRQAWFKHGMTEGDKAKLATRINEVGA
jgi:hypothetical protein